MRKENPNKWFIEKDDKLYINLPESEKKKAHKYFKDLKGLIKSKKSAIEILKELRREVQMNTEHMQQMRVRQRV